MQSNVSIICAQIVEKSYAWSQYMLLTHTLDISLVFYDHKQNQNPSI